MIWHGHRYRINFSFLHPRWTGANSGLTFLFSSKGGQAPPKADRRKEKLQKKLAPSFLPRRTRVAGAKTSFFAKVPVALLLLKKLTENFLTLINRLLPTHCAMVQEKCRMRDAKYGSGSRIKSGMTLFWFLLSIHAFLSIFSEYWQKIIHIH